MAGFFLDGQIAQTIAQTLSGFGLSWSSLYSLIARLTSLGFILPSFASAASAACAIQ